MEYLYLVCLLISISVMVLLILFDVRNSISQYLIVIIGIISSFGYYFLAISRTIEEALFAQIISYVGCVFLPVFYCFSVLEICHLVLSKYIKIFLVLCQVVVYGTVCTVGRSDMFYKTVEFYKYNGVSMLEKNYGPFHSIAIGSMYLYLICSFGIVIYAGIKKKSVDKKNVFSMLTLMSLAMVLYAVERIFDLKYEFIPVAYDVLMLGALIPICDFNIYTVYENKDIVNKQLSNVGFLTFDTKLAYKGCDDYMENVFPELSKYNPGQIIRKSSADLQRLISHINSIDKNKSKKDYVPITIKEFCLNDRYYDGMIHILTNPFKKLKGYTIELRDNTEHYKSLALKEQYNHELAKEVKEKTKQIKIIQEKTILGMAQMVESRDLSTGGHIKRTSDVVRIFAKKLRDTDLGLDKKFLKLVIRSAPMHDLGKIGVDDAVLRKQGRFTDEEYEKMKKHSEIGYHMVSEILTGVEDPDFVRVAENVAHYHHEKVDGTGYPHGLKGDEIPIEARIMALADVFDALVSKRCYKEAFSYERAYGIIEKDAGTHFDKRLAEVFLTCKEELENYYNSSEK